MEVRRFIKTIFLVLAAGSALGTAPAMACPILVKASPRVGSTVEKPVNQVSLYFSGPIDPSGSELTVLDKQGRNVTNGKLRGSGNPADTIAVPVKHLEPGTYKVTWRILCHCEDDDSVFPGSYSFIVK
jgi:methionine-rich copper-binding protein CopC